MLGICSQCHAPHGGPNRFGLKASGKEVCYGCHKPVDAGKVKHAAIERFADAGARFAGRSILAV